MSDKFTLVILTILLLQGCAITKGWSSEENNEHSRFGVSNDYCNKLITHSSSETWEAEFDVKNDKL